MRHPRYLRGLVLLFAVLATSADAQERRPDTGDQVRPAIGIGHLTIRVREISGGPLRTQALVRLRPLVGAGEHIATTSDGSQATFQNLSIGQYRALISAPGYQDADIEAEVLMRDSTSFIFVELQPEGVAKPMEISIGPPILAPKASKELQKGLEALHAGDFHEARQRLERVAKLAPTHPDAHYLLGVLEVKLNNLPAARTHLEAAVRAYSLHRQALNLLGSVLLELERTREAAATFEQALVAGARGWELHWTLAVAYFKLKEFEKARAHAERIPEIAPPQAPQAELLLVRIDATEGRREEALGRLADFLKRRASHPLAAQARELEQRLRPPAAPQPMAASTPRGETVAPPPPAPAALPPAAAAVLPPRSWTPPDVDDAVPPIEPGIACALPQVLNEAGQRVARLAEMLQQFIANETIEHTMVNSSGHPAFTERRTFEYVVHIRELRNGSYAVEETREPERRFREFPAQFVSNGLAALAFLFHPQYVDDFEMTCEGLGRIRGQPAWQLRFQQRGERPVRIRSYRIGGGRYPIVLKGRAWISATHYEVMRLESSLAESVPNLRLEREQLVVDYAPVEFPGRDGRVWLPSRSEMYVQIRGKRYVHRHLFSDFRLFFVNAALHAKTPEVLKKKQ